MVFGTSGVLAIEVGFNRLHLVHGAVFGNRLKVYDFATEELLISSPENVAQQLERLVGRKRFGSSLVALALSGPGVVHRLLDFPSMPLNELGLVVGREMRTMAGPGGKDVVFDWEMIEEIGSGALKQVRVLVAMAAGSQVEEALQLLDRCYLKPALLTTAPISLLRSLRFVQGGGDGLRAVLYMGGQQGYLLGTKDGVWSFQREFSGRPSGRMDALMGEALREANRALLYYRQRHREVGEITFLLGGENGLEDLQARLQRETGAQGEIVRPGSGLDLTPLEERANVFRDIFPSFMIPLGLVAATAAHGGINLAPRTVRKSVARLPDIDFSFVYRPVLPVILLLVFLGVHLILVRTERHYQKLLEDRAALYVQWLPAIRAAEEGRGLRDNEKLLEESLGGSSRIGKTSWVVLFKALSRLPPPDLILQSMTLQKDKEEWIITLKGQVVSLDPYTAQAAFNRFYQGLKRSPHLERIELLPLNVSTIMEGAEGPGTETLGAPAQTKAEGVRIKKTKVQFEVRGYSKGI